MGFPRDCQRQVVTGYLVSYSFWSVTGSQGRPGLGLPQQHERIQGDGRHAQPAAQVRAGGWLRFYADYLWQYGKGRMRGLDHAAAYRAISYEAEAYAHPHVPGYR